MALGGEIAGPARRFCELSHELAVVCASERPDASIARFEQLSRDRRPSGTWRGASRGPDGRRSARHARRRHPLRRSARNSFA